MPSSELPPIEFQKLVCGPTDAHLFEEVGRWLCDFLTSEAMLQRGGDFLDVGCGCGRLARQLIDHPLRSYTGFDRHEGMILWCNRAIAAHHPRFHFDYFPLKSVYEVWDAEPGSIDVGSFVFPYPAQAFDAAMLASVFTHMPPDEVRHYLSELARVMRSGGKVLLSMLFAEGAAEVRDDVNVFQRPAQFIADLSSFPFDVRPATARFAPGTAFEAPNDSAPATLSFGYVQNWYVLTRL